MSQQALKFVLIPLILISVACSHSQVRTTSSVRKNLIRKDYKPNEIRVMCEQAIKDVETNIELLGEALSDNQAPRDFTHTYLALDTLIYNFNDVVEPLSFMGNVHSDPLVREEGIECEEKVGQFFVQLYTSKDLYDLIKDVPAEAQNLVASQALIQEIKKNFERNGMKLTPVQLEEFKKLKKELSTLEAQYSKILIEDKSFLVFTSEQLQGAPEAFLARLEKDKKGLYLVTMKRTDYNQVMENVSVVETRKKMHEKYQQRGGSENIDLLQKAITIRQRLAEIMGFKTWVDYQTRNRMAGSAAQVLNFYSQIQSKLVRKNKKNLADLFQFKKTQDASAKNLAAWDVVFYYNLLKKQKYNLDDEKVREYFPKDYVMEGLFHVYETLFHVTFEEVSGADVWSPEVKLYVVKDKDTRAVISYFYTDFIPRKGKFGHAAAFTLIKGRRLPSGDYSQPVSAIVANFNPPSPDRPALLSHKDVETLFHEFGHIIHQNLTRAPYGMISGTNVARDFVEAPSQMLEDWVWDKNILLQISGHYTDTTKKMPVDMIDSMIASKNIDQGYTYSRQLYLGLLDFTLHTQHGALDVVAINKNIYKKIIGLETIENDLFPANFGHLMGGYDAGYYGYMWSNVFAADMFSEFESKGILNPELGQKYRHFILEQGATVNPRTLVEKFLGRKSNTKAFYKRLGI